MASNVPILSASLIVSILLLFGILAKGDMNLNSSTDGARPARMRSLESKNAFDVHKYGAYGDGLHDDTEALSKAWTAACASSRPAVVFIRKGMTYLVKHVTLSGPCKSSIVLMIEGTLVAPAKRSDWSKETIRHWIMFRSISGLTVAGGGTIDGNGKIWWRNSCKTNPKLPCTEAPTALTFHSCTNLRVEELKLVNSQQIHMSVEDCRGVELSRLSITAPATSPNTDGIHIARSSRVEVTGCVIGTGDDCMSVEDGTEHLRVRDMACGPGHGISVGSLGDGGAEAKVENVTVDGARLRGTTNGARIKTGQGGRGYARGIVFRNIVMDGVWNPIVIDQNYCDSSTPWKNQKSAVEVSNVLFKNIRGTSASKEAIKLHCSKTVPCHGITLQDIKLTLKAGGGGHAKSTCQNAKWRKSGTVMPQPCSFGN